MPASWTVRANLAGPRLATVNSRRAWLSALAAVAGLVFSLCVAVAPAQAADAPTDLHGVSRTQSRIQVAWTAVEGEYYKIRYATRSDFSDGRIVKSIEGSPYTLTGLKPGTLYYLRIAVTDASGNAQSGWSATATYPTRPLMKISVGTYNIKDPDSTAQGPWTTRGPRAAAAVIGQGVQLLGVQEVFEDDDRQEFLDYVNVAAGGDANYEMAPEPDLSAGEDSRIVYDSTRFTLKASGGQLFSYQNGSEERAWAWGWFEHKTSLRNVFFVTTHLSPRSDTADVRQWSQLLAWVKNKVASLGVSAYVIITGDFNTTKFEPPATMLDVSRRNYGYEDVLGQIRNSYSTYRNPAQRVDAWISSSNRGLRDVREYSVATNRNSNSIDYIFVSKALKVPYYRVYAQPRSGYIMDYLASDHFLVRAIVSQ